MSKKYEKILISILKILRIKFKKTSDFNELVTILEHTSSSFSPVGSVERETKETLIKLIDMIKNKGDIEEINILIDKFETMILNMRDWD